MNSNRNNDSQSQIFSLKTIIFDGKQFKIVMQDENGPCPLIALANIMILRGVLRTDRLDKSIEYKVLLQQVASILLERAESIKSQANTGTAGGHENVEYLLGEALQILGKLYLGMDINVRFRGIYDYEHTQELALFDVAQIDLVHAWVFDDTYQRLFQRHKMEDTGFNQLMTMIATYNELLDKKKPTKEDIVEMEKGRIAKRFFEEYPHQITAAGLANLFENVNEGQFGVFFRGNHYSTLLKYNGALYMLATDVAFRDHPNVVWQRLDSISGTDTLIDCNFRVYDPRNFHDPNVSAQIGKNGGTGAAGNGNQMGGTPNQGSNTARGRIQGNTGQMIPQNAGYGGQNQMGRGTNSFQGNYQGYQGYPQGYQGVNTGNRPVYFAGEGIAPRSGIQRATTLDKDHQMALKLQQEENKRAQQAGNNGSRSARDNRRQNPYNKKQNRKQQGDDGSCAIF